MKLLMLSLLIISSTALASPTPAQCQADPFLEGCAINSGNISTKTSVLCNSGAIKASVDVGTRASESADAVCNGEGGIAAYVDESNRLNVVGNQNNVATGAIGSASAGAAASTSAGSSSYASSGTAPTAPSYTPPPSYSDDGTIIWLPSTGGSGTSSVGITSGGGGCASECDCGTYETCNAGTCVNISSGGGACWQNGSYVGGDATCRFLCSGGYFVCPAPPPGPCSGK